MVAVSVEWLAMFLCLWWCFGVVTYRGMVTPAFSQAWMRAEPAARGLVSKARTTAREGISRAYLRWKPFFRLPEESTWSARGISVVNGGASGLTNRQLHLSRAMGCRRKCPRGTGSPATSPPGRAGQRVTKHGRHWQVVRRYPADGSDAEAREGVVDGGQRLGRIEERPVGASPQSFSACGLLSPGCLGLLWR